MIQIRSFSKCGKLGYFLGLIIVLSCLVYTSNSNAQEINTLQIDEDEVWDKALQMPTATNTETPYTSTPTPSFTPEDTSTPTITSTSTPTPTEATSALRIVTIPPGTPIMDDIIIQEGEVWIIEPGSVFNFHEESAGASVYLDEYDRDRPEIIIYGKMIADASGADTIVFRAVTAAPTATNTPTETPTPFNTPFIPPTIVLPTASFTPTVTVRPTRTPTLTPTPNDEFTYVPTDIPVDIPDVTPAYIISEIYVNSIGEVVDVNVPMDVSHLAISQLVITLSHENTIVTLHDGNNGTHDGQENILWTYDDEGDPLEDYIPLPNDIDTKIIPDGTPENLSAFNGKPAGGSWILTISDFVPDITGTLNYWELDLKETNFLPTKAPALADINPDVFLDSFTKKKEEFKQDINNLPGKWYGIRFMDSADPGSILRNVDISGAVNAVEMNKVSIPVIDSNLHHNTHYGVLLKEDSYPLIRGNRITNNNVDAIRIEENCGPVIYDNYFKDNIEYGIHTKGISAPVITKDNVFTGNTIGVFIDDHSKPNLGDIDNNRIIDASDEYIADDGFNTFRDNYLYDIYNNNRNMIKAQNNFWGTLNEQEVDARIFDDNENYGYSGKVMFTPLGQIVDPNSTATPTRMPQSTFTPTKTPTPANYTSTPTRTPTPYTVITGVINQDQVWTGVVVLDGNVTIPRGVSVIVRPQTIVKGTDEQTFLTVLGTIYVEGDEGYNGRVKFISMNDSEKWGGIIIKNSHYIESEIRNAYFKFCNTAIAINNSRPSLENVTFEECTTALDVINIPLSSSTSPCIRKCWFKDNGDAVLIHGETSIDLGLTGSNNPGLNVFHNNTREITVLGDDLEFTVPAKGNYFSIIDASQNYVRLETAKDLEDRVTTDIVDVEPLGTITDGHLGSRGSVLVMNSVITEKQEEIWSGVVELHDNILIQGKLTILEGTEIIINPAWNMPQSYDDHDYERLTIDVQGGTLIAKGFGLSDINENEPPESAYVHFHSGSNPGEVSPCDWGGIRFFDGSDDSVLKHVLIEDCKVGVSVYQSSPTLSHMIFNNIGDRAVYVSSEDASLNIPDYISIQKAYVDPDTMLMPDERYTFTIDINYGLYSVLYPGESYGMISYYIISNPYGWLYYNSYNAASGENINRLIVPDSVVIPIGAQTVTLILELYGDEGLEAQQMIDYGVYVAPTPTPAPDSIEITDISISPETQFISPGQNYIFDVTTSFFLMPGEARYLDYRVVTNTNEELYKNPYNRVPLVVDATNHHYTIPAIEAPAGYSELRVLAELYDGDRIDGLIDEGTLLNFDSRTYLYTSPKTGKKSYLSKSSSSFLIPEPIIEYCKLIGDDFAVYSKEAAPILEGNSFLEYNRAGIYMKGAYVPNMGTVDIHNNQEAGGNSFNSVFARYNLWNDSENPVNAHANYWGSTDIYSIDQRIFDDEENVYSGPVDIAGYLPNTQPKFTAGDINKDYAVNTVDLYDLIEGWHKTVGDSKFKANADLNFDYAINYKDLMILTGIMSK